MTYQYNGLKWERSELNLKPSIAHEPVTMIKFSPDDSYFIMAVGLG